MFIFAQSSQEVKLPGKISKKVAAQCEPGSPMNLDDAITAHASWKVKFRMAIQNQEQLDEVAIRRDDRCALGKWLHEEAGSGVQALPECADLKLRHRTFHTVAADVAKLINSRDFVKARAAIGVGTNYEETSASVCTAILALKRAAKML